MVALFLFSCKAVTLFNLKQLNSPIFKITQIISKAGGFLSLKLNYNVLNSCKIR